MFGTTADFVMAAVVRDLVVAAVVWAADVGRSTSLFNGSMKRITRYARSASIKCCSNSYIVCLGRLVKKFLHCSNVFVYRGGKVIARAAALPASSRRCRSDNSEIVPGIGAVVFGTAEGRRLRFGLTLRRSTN